MYVNLIFINYDNKVLLYKNCCINCSIYQLLAKKGHLPLCKLFEGNFNSAICLSLPHDIFSRKSSFAAANVAVQHMVSALD